VVILFEGRDAAGKGGAIKRFMEHLNPRGARVVALESPTTWNVASGTSSATSRTCRRLARSCCSTAAGTTAPAFKERKAHPLKQWKLSPIDMASLDKWDDCTHA